MKRVKWKMRRKKAEEDEEEEEVKICRKRKNNSKIDFVPGKNEEKIKN